MDVPRGTLAVSVPNPTTDPKLFHVEHAEGCNRLNTRRGSMNSLQRALWLPEPDRIKTRIKRQGERTHEMAPRTDNPLLCFSSLPGTIYSHHPGTDSSTTNGSS